MAAPTNELRSGDIPPKSQWYVEKYDPDNLTFVDVGEYKIPMPVPPPEWQMINHGLSEDDSIFRRITIPTDVLRTKDQAIRDAYSEYMWHLRLNGVWIIIKDKPMYLNGHAWFFFNWWFCEIGDYADFRMEAVEYFNFVHMCDQDPRSFGAVITKGRRLGDTEKSLCITFDIITREKHSKSGMQNMNEDDAKNDFDRVVEAWKKLPFFFFPTNRGGKTPQLTLDFRYDSDEEDGVDNLQLNSQYTFKPSKLRKYDGWRLRCVRMGEWGKIPSFDINEQWEILKRCISEYNGAKVIGIGVHESTVEDLGEGKDSLERAEKFWEESDPKFRLSNGQTHNGLYHLFRSARLSAPVDKWGFHKQKEAVLFITEQKRRLAKEKRFKNLADFMRKNPLDISDVFSPPNDQCDLLPEILDARKVELDSGEDSYGNKVEVAGNYNLYWTSGMGSSVVAKPSPSGRFFISQMPKLANAKKTSMNGRLILPEFGEDYTLGVDPVDHKKTDTSKGSSIAAVVFRNRKDTDEDMGRLKFSQKEMDFPDENKHLLKTDQYVATYVYAPVSPKESYEDIFMLAVFYGGIINCENNRPAFNNWMEAIGYQGYLYVDPYRVSSKSKVIPYGMTATASSIDVGIDYLRTFIEYRWQTIRHKELLGDFRKFKRENRTKRDLTVAAYFALLVAYRREIRNHKIRDKALQRVPWQTT